MADSLPPRRSFFANLFSDEWQMPIALSAGVSLLIGYSLQVLVDEQTAGAWAGYFHSVGHALVWVSLALGAVHGLKAAAESLAEREPNIDVLMVVGAGLAASIGHPGEGALLLFMFTLAGALEHRAMAKAKDAVARLSKLMPNEAIRRVGDGSAWEPVKAEELRVDDLVLVRPGETVPADGTVEKGQTTVDQSHLTGESLPRAVERDDDVFAGTMNQNGAIEVRVSRPVSESSLQKVLQLVLEAQEQRQPLQRVIDKFSTPYTLSVFVIAAFALVLLATTGIGGGEGPLSWADAAYRAITLLIVAAYVLIAGLLSDWLSRFYRISAFPVAVVTIAACSLAVLPLRRRVQNWVDAAFYPSRRANREAVGALGRDLAFQTAAEQAHALVLDRLHDLYRPARSVLFLAPTPEAKALVPIGRRPQTMAAPPAVPVDDPLLSSLDRLRRPMFAEEFADLTPAADTATVRLLDLRERDLLIPLITSNRVLGLLLLGPKADGALYSQEDLANLGSLARQAAPLLESLRLHAAT
ncbi:MAG: HAD-IC family P-type ATPase, partial [Phycisphaerales bacterium]